MAERFLFLIGSLKTGGAERNVAKLANHLVAQGHDVVIAVFIDNIAFSLDSKVKIISIDHKKYKSRLLSAFYVILKLRSLVNSMKPRRLISMSRLAGLLVSSVCFSRTVVRFDSYPLLGYKEYKKWQFWFFYNLPWVKYVVCPSKELRDDVSRYFLNKRKLVVVYNPVPMVQATTITASPLNERPYFIVVSRLSGLKNIANVIEAYYRSTAFEMADLMILGDGPEMERLKSITKEFELENYVKFKGFVTDPYPHIARAICLINASMKEGFPNILVESLALGTPVISSLAKTGPKEIVFDGKNGLLFEVGNYDKLAELMSMVLTDTCLYNRLKQNVKTGLERFTHERVMGAWEKILLN